MSAQELRDLHHTLCGGGRTESGNHCLDQSSTTSSSQGQVGHLSTGNIRGNGTVGGRGSVGHDRGRDSRPGDCPPVATPRPCRSSTTADPPGTDAVDAPSGSCRILPAREEVSAAGPNASPSIPEEVKSMILDCIGHEQWKSHPEDTVDALYFQDMQPKVHNRMYLESRNDAILLSALWDPRGS